MSAPPAILVARLSALGDVVLASAVAVALRERFSAARLEFLAAEGPGRILAWVPGLDALHLWRGRGPAPEGVRGRRWDWVIDLSGTARSRRLLARAPAARRLAIRKQTIRRHAFVRLRALGANGGGIASAIDRMFATVAPLGVAREDRRPRLDVPPPPPDGPVLLAPGAGRDPKRWPAARFRDLAVALEQDGRKVLLVGSADERALLAEAGEGTRAEIFAAPDAGRLPPVVARCPVAVTNDSGLLHVAEACGAAVVAIFGPTHPRLGFAPLSPRSVVAHAGTTCSPCDVHGPARCPKRHHRCMLDVTVESVRERVRALDAAVGVAT